MSDNTKDVGKRDRDRVAAGQPHEVRYLVEKFGLSKEVVEKAIQQHGPMRTDVEAQLERMKSNRNN